MEPLNFTDINNTSPTVLVWIGSWNLACANIMGKYAMTPNFSHLQWRMTEMFRDPLGVQRSTSAANVCIVSKNMYYWLLFKNSLFWESKVTFLGNSWPKTDTRIKIESKEALDDAIVDTSQGSQYKLLLNFWPTHWLL